MKAHRTDKVSLTFGLLFLAIATWWLLAQLLDLAVPAVGWFVAGGLIVFGALGLLAALRSGAGATTAGGPGPTDAPGAPSPTDALATAVKPEPRSLDDEPDTQPLDLPVDRPGDSGRRA